VRDLFREIDVTPEEEEELIKKAAELVHKYGMDVAAILFLETVKPVVYIGGQMGRFFLYPFIPFFGEKVTINSEKFFTVFEKRENVEKLLKLVEEKTKEKETQVREETQPKKSWRRLLPFQGTV